MNRFVECSGLLPSATITGPGEWDRYSSGSSRLRHGGVDCWINIAEEKEE